MISRIACVSFWLAWITAGSTIDRMFDDWHAAIIVVVAMIVTVVCAAVICSYEDN